MDNKTQITIEAYNKNAESFEQKFFDLKLYINSFDKFSRFIQDGDHIADFGCGPGNVCKYVFEKFPNAKIEGFDLSSEMIKLAEKNVPKATFHIKDIRDIKDISNETFDAIIAAFCIPFLYDEEMLEFLENISQKCKKSGHIYLSAMLGKGCGFRIPSFSNGDEMFFNYYNEEFLEKSFCESGLIIQEKILQDYPLADGSILKDAIFILKKR